jgi:hypothetical protein
MGNTVIVALISLISMVVGYYFGSSDGSAKKTSLLSQSTDPTKFINAQTVEVPDEIVPAKVSDSSLIGAVTTESK